VPPPRPLQETTWVERLAFFAAIFDKAADAVRHTAPSDRQQAGVEPREAE